MSRAKIMSKLKYLVIFGWLFFIIAPYLWMFITSLKPPVEIYTKTINYWPNNPTIESYISLLKTTPFIRYFSNSLLVALSTTAIALIASVTAAFVFSRLPFRGSRGLLSGMLVSQMVPAILLAIPLFLIFNKLSFINSIVKLILAHSTYAIPFATWTMTGFINEIPRSIDEAAAIDGASPLQIFWHVLLPLIIPGVVGVATYIFIFSWKEFLYALTLTSRTVDRTLPIGLHTFMGEYTIRWDLLTSAGVITVIPVILIFVLGQKYLIAGLTAGSTKG